MKKIGIIFLLLTFVGVGAWAQKLKTRVCIVGNDVAAISAGIQSARSGVKTLLILNYDHLSKQVASQNSPNPLVLQSGIWAEIVAKYSGQKPHIGVLSTTFTYQTDSVIKTIKCLTDTIKNLTVLPFSPLSEIKKSGGNWELRLSNGRKIKSYVVVDADASRPILKKLGLTLPKNNGLPIQLSDHVYRTSVAVLDSNKVLPLMHLLPEKLENILIVPLTGSLPARMHAGQAAGASAAFCAFFDTKTTQLNVRLIQNELLSYKASVYPLEDVHQSDSNFIAIQHLALTGLLSTTDKPSTWLGTADIKANVLSVRMKPLYSRSQIWFADHPTNNLNIQQAIDLITYTATRGKELRSEIERGWQSTLKLTSKFEENRTISRTELAMLLDAYLNPFATQVGLDGEWVN